MTGTLLYVTSCSLILYPFLFFYVFQLAKLRTPSIVTTDFLYVRFIGDRSINEKDFGRIQKDRVLEMKEWADQIALF
jgi:hypothetical protein